MSHWSFRITEMYILKIEMLNFVENSLILTDMC